MTLKTDIDQIAVDAGKLHDIVHGGPTAVVATDGGTVKSVAKALADLEAQVVSGAGSYLVQCQAETALSTAQAQTATNQAAAAAGSALSAASVVAQDLSAIDRTVYTGSNITAAIIYDTSKDSDGGAWRKRCAHTSWENETLSGNWLGSAANEAAARAISGATTGSLYYDTTAAKFYTLNAGAGKTETYRGNVRQFPAQVLITVESARLVIWDITQAGCPMWMVFVANSGAFRSAVSANSVCAGNGCVYIGQKQGSDGNVTQIEFIADLLHMRYTDAKSYYRQTIANRSTASSVILDGVFGGSLVAVAVNDVAMTVLPNAPVDVATGLPVPTIAVATDGNATYSTSAIKDDGTVVNVASDSTGTAVGVEFDGLALKVIRSDGTVYIWNDVRALTTGASPSATITASSTPAILGTASKQAKRSKGSSTGLTMLRRNELTLASSMLAYITHLYNTGWMPGDIRGAWLADTVAETLTGAELVTNGGLTVDATGWTTLNGAGLAHGANGVTITNAGATYGGIYQALNGLTVGESYTVSCRVTGSYGVPARIGAPTSVPTVASGLGETAVDGTLLYTFAATATTHYLVVGNRNDSGGYNTFGPVSLRLADIDRSIKAKGLQVNGSITKAAVASGAQLMGYSGFSAANFLEQPYNSGLDFGTGDFCVMGWVKTDGNVAVVQTLFVRDASGGTASFMIDISAAEVLEVGYLGGSFLTITATIPATPSFICVYRSSGTLYAELNGVAVGSGADSQNWTIKWANPVIRLGLRAAGIYPADETTMALWRVSATVPSANQRKHIYETEKKLFEANANCLLAGTSDAITALAYDDETDILHVGTSYGRSAFKGLTRVASEATPVGAITVLSAGAGVIVQGGATAVDVYVPAYLLREELLRDAEQMAKFGQNLIAHDFTATASQTNFALPVGWEIVAVYQQGALKRETTSWTRSFDGFVWSAVLGTGATVSDWISILAKRV